MPNDELSGEILYLFDPDPDEEMPREFPHSRIINHHRLDVSYMKTFAPEGTTTHRYTRKCSAKDEELHAVDRNMDVPLRLFLASLRLFGDSILEYDGLQKRVGDLRYYPPVILTFWSGFEAFVRYTSELLVITVVGIPDAVKNYLKEQEVVVDDKGQVRSITRHYSVLNRYSLLLRYGYNLKADKGSTYWQNLKKAQELRDYYTHVGIRESRAINSTQVIQYLEDVLMGIIVPSCLLQRTLLLNMYSLYSTWAKLGSLCEEYSEQPFFHDKPFNEGYLFHCNFENVDAEKFPSWPDQNEIDSDVPAVKQNPQTSELE